MTFFLCCSLSLAQSQDQIDRINKNFDQLNNRKFDIQVPGNISAPTGKIQTTGAIQKAGNIQIPRGIQAITVKDAKCKRSLLINADTLFDFDKSTLSPYAEEALKIAGAKIKAMGPHPMRIEGHTDAIGGDDYNQHLSEARAERVMNWLLENDFIAKGQAQSSGYGKKRPVAPNTNPDGSDNPKGRQRNRRVEIVVDTCTAWNQTN
jgi:outer membrane protein OmpA-like peptidoglycan-associated protein